MFIEKTPNEYSQEIKAKRESLGLSIEDVFQKTRIRSTYIQAIENSEFQRLPDPVYSKNFIKTYARFLGIDEEPVLQNYVNYINSQTPAPLKNSEETLIEKSSFKSSLPKILSNKIFWIIFLSLLIIILWLLLIPKQTQTPADTVDSANQISGESLIKTEQQATDTANQAVTVPHPLNSSESKITPGTKRKSVLVIHAVEESWLRIKADENPPFQILLQPGEKYESSAEKFNIDIGNAGGVKIKYQGKNVENPGKTGEVIHLRLP
jgi:cytoskeletal protein RodZ